MILLPGELAPSSLFYTDDLPKPIRDLLNKAHRYREAGDLEAAARYAQQAAEASARMGLPAGRAASLLHLADVQREAGRTALAIDQASAGYEIIQRQAALAQRHNEAVIAYGLGLLHHLVGSSPDALRWYQTAVRLLDTARDHWATLNAGARVRECERVRRWVESLVECLTRAEAQDGPCSTLIIPVRLVGGGRHPLPAVELRVKGYLLGQRLLIDGRPFQVHRLNGGDAAILTGEEYGVFPVPDSVGARVGAEVGDYVLTQRTEQEDLDVRYYVREEAAGLEFGHFRRDPTGRVYFESMETGRRVIGGPGDEPTAVYYCPVALLRPER
jgi:tetratricopeptide (TPR) repeat protein